jgi:hypothetical protein
LNTRFAEVENISKSLCIIKGLWSAFETHEFDSNDLLYIIVFGNLARNDSNLDRRVTKASQIACVCFGKPKSVRGRNVDGIGLKRLSFAN